MRPHDHPSSLDAGETLLLPAQHLEAAHGISIETADDEPDFTREQYLELHESLHKKEANR